MFEREAIELADLAHLTEEDLEALGLPMGPRKRLLRAVGEDQTTAGQASNSLAQTIRQTPGAMEGERRLVTILFADVANSTDLVQHLDPEAVAELLDPVQHLLLDAVHRYGGTINEVRGDGVMAIFGAPVAQEDHALRACQAALDMQGAMAGLAAGPSGPILLRVGLNAGDAVVRVLENDLQASYSAMGMMTLLAARMEQTATPGTIRLALPVMRLVADDVEAAALPPVTVKGVVEPVPAFELKALRPARSRLEARIARGLTPFVGRKNELGQLQVVFDAVEAGDGKAVAITAEPGLGKSRLVHELQNRLGARATWRLGQCVSHRTAEAFHPIGDLLGRSFGLGDDDLPTTRRRVVAGILADAAVGGDDALQQCLPYLAWLAGGETAPGELDTDPQLRRAATFEAVTTFLLAAAERSPQVVVIEDLHWADQATRELLERLIDALPCARIMLLVTTRPGGGRLPERSHVTRLALAAMAPDEAESLLAAVLGRAGVDAALGRAVQAKAEGNPFFVEELVRSLTEAGRLRLAERWQLEPGTDAAAVPGTIQQVLMERIDRLDEPARRLLQIAAVIGRSFARRVLAEVDSDFDDGALRRLQEAEFVQLKASQPEPLYQFKHALIQEVAYASLLQRTQRQLHARVAAAILAHHDQQLADQHGTLGHHLAAAEDWEPAARHLEAAADRTFEAAAPADASALLQRAVACRSKIDAPAGRALAALHAKQATVLQTLSRVADAHAAASRAAALAAAGAAPEVEGLAQAQMSLASFYLHDFPRARTEAGRAIAIGRELGSAEIRAAGGCALGWVEAVSGELDAARRTLGEAGTLAREAALPTCGIIATAVQAQIDHWQGDYGRSIRRLRDETLPLVATGRRGETSALLFPRLLALFSLGLPLAGKGAFGEAHATFTEGLALAERVGDEIFRMRFLNSLGHVLAECGDIDAARPLNEQSREFALRRQDSEVLANAELNLADGWLAQGDPSLAREIGQAVLGVVKSPTTSGYMRWRYAQHLFASLGETSLAQGKLAPATDYADQCLDLATRTRSLKYVARGWRLKAGVARARGDAEAAGEMLQRALQHARRARNPGQIWRSELALGAFLQETGKHDAAGRRFAAARRCLAGIEHRLEQNPALREAFATSRLFEDAFGAARAR